MCASGIWIRGVNQCWTSIGEWIVVIYKINNGITEPTQPTLGLQYQSDQCSG